LHQPLVTGILFLTVTITVAVITSGDRPIRGGQAMFPYQIYQALSEQRIRDLMAEARRHELTVAARNVPRNPIRPSSRLKGVAARLVALLHLRGGAPARSTMTTPSGAGPMGCVA
jgi:hypothetical protein